MSHGRFQSFQTKAPSLCYEGESVGVRFDKVYGISVSLFLQTSAQQMRTAFLNWDRQKVPKLQLFLLFPLHWGTGGFHEKKVCPSVRLSSTIWVCKTRKWFEHFVRGTVETENSLNTHISRLCSESWAKT